MNQPQTQPPTLSDVVRALADRVDEAVCAAAGLDGCRALQPLDLLMALNTLADIADAVEALEEHVCGLKAVLRDARRARPAPVLGLVRGGRP